MNYYCLLCGGLTDILQIIFFKLLFFCFLHCIIEFHFRYRDPCSASIDEDDLHTTKLVGDSQKRVSILCYVYICTSSSQKQRDFFPELNFACRCNLEIV